MTNLKDAASVLTETKIKGNDALKVFEVNAQAAEQGQMALIVSGAVCLLVHSYLSPKEADRNMKGKDIQNVIDGMDQALRTKGLKKSSQYRYLGMAKQFGLKLWSDRDKHAAAIGIICHATKAADATARVIAWLKTDCKVTSIDGLEYFLTGKNRQSGSVVTTQKEDGTTVTATVAKKTPKQIATAVQGAENVQALAGSILSAHKFKALDIITNLLTGLETPTDCDELIEKITERRNMLAAQVAAGTQAPPLQPGSETGNKVAA